MFCCTVSSYSTIPHEDYIKKFQIYTSQNINCNYVLVIDSLRTCKHFWNICNNIYYAILNLLTSHYLSTYFWYSYKLCMLLHICRFYDQISLSLQTLFVTSDKLSSATLLRLPGIIFATVRTVFIPLLSAFSTVNQCNIWTVGEAPPTCRAALTWMIQDTVRSFKLFLFFFFCWVHAEGELFIVFSYNCHGNRIFTLFFMLNSLS